MIDNNSREHDNNLLIIDEVSEIESLKIELKLAKEQIEILEFQKKILTELKEGYKTKIEKLKSENSILKESMKLFNY